MTKLNLKNSELAAAINLLNSLDLQNRHSRNRSKLVNLLMPVYQDYDAELNDLNDKYVLKDEKGKPVPDPKGQGNKIIPDKLAEYQKLVTELANEEVVIEGGVYASNIDALYKDLSELSKSLTGTDAQIYDRILDEYEKNENIKGDK